jgi:hypothetical protein
MKFVARAAFAAALLLGAAAPAAAQERWLLRVQSGNPVDDRRAKATG